MMEQGWYSGHIFGIKKILVIATVISLVIFPVTYIMLNIPRTAESVIIGPPNQILFLCNHNPCPSQGAWNVTNDSPTVIETVSPTYSCDCIANVTFSYSPSFTTTYDNRTTVSNAHTIPIGQTMTIFASAYRIDGIGNVTVNLGVLP